MVMMAEKRPRISREELRTLLLEQGQAILQEEGLGSGAVSLTFKKVFDRVESDTGIHLTNASVIRRVWENQAEFQTDVLAAVAEDENRDEVDRTIGAVAPLLEGLDLTTVDSRDRALRELCRVGGAANVEAVRESGYWPLSIAVWAVAVFDARPRHRQQLESALTTGYDAFTARITEAYAGLAAFLGLRLREQFTMQQFAVAAEAFGEGCGLRDRVGHTDLRGITRHTGPGDDPQEWTLFAVGFEALVRMFFEFDPDWQPPGRGQPSSDAEPPTG
jgi:hypothetical protein